MKLIFMLLTFAVSFSTFADLDSPNGIMSTIENEQNWSFDLICSEASNVENCITKYAEINATCSYNEFLVDLNCKSWSLSCQMSADDYQEYYYSSPIQIASMTRIHNKKLLKDSLNGSTSVTFSPVAVSRDIPTVDLIYDIYGKKMFLGCIPGTEKIFTSTSKIVGF